VKKAKKRIRIDIATAAGLIVAAVGILGGLVLEGGKIQDVQQITAALIVVGGTLGAVMITTPARTLLRALRALPRVLVEPADPRPEALGVIINLAGKARRSGVISLDSELETISDPFLHKALMLAVDGTDAKELRSMMNLEIAREEGEGDSIAHVLESAGGYAPTIGIIGAVLGLIQVMKHLGNIEEVGQGIAVAFVATIYGVGLANLILLPGAAKLRASFAEQTRSREMILEGIISILEGMNPRLIRLKLEAFLPLDRTGHHVRSTPPVSADAPAWTSNAPNQVSQ
jgi:chemotaxis protein MotA